MQLALDASVAETVSQPGAASTDIISFSEHIAAPRQRSRHADIPALWRTNARLKHAPPNLMGAGAVTISYVKSADMESARRFVDAITLLRQWGRDLITANQPAALEAVAS